MKKRIVVAGGCFWGVQEYYSRLYGIISTTVGYANGSTDSPTYEDVKSQKTGYAESVYIEYDNELISLEQILDHFLRIVDPYSLNKQGEDEGTQYRTGIYYHDPIDGMLTKAYFDRALKPGYAIEVKPLGKFHTAEEYHQDYLKKNEGGYCHVNMWLIKTYEKKDLTLRDYASLCVDYYRDVDETSFESLSSIVYYINRGRKPYPNDSDMYDILNYFVELVCKENIPMYFYKVPGPYNEPITQSFRKICKNAPPRYCTSCVCSGEESAKENAPTYDEPLSADELVKKMKT